MAAHDQKDIDAILAQGSRKRVSVEPGRPSSPCVSPPNILEAIQPSLTRLCSTAHLEKLLQLHQIQKNSLTDTVESRFRDNAIAQHAGETVYAPSIVQQHISFVSAPIKPEDNDGRGTSSDTYPSSSEHRRSLPAGDLNRLNDASLNTTLAQQLLYEEDLAIDHMTEGSSSFTQEFITLDSPESKSRLKGSETLPKLASIIEKQLSGIPSPYPKAIRNCSQHKEQLRQHHAPVKPQTTLARIVPTTCTDQFINTHELSKPKKGLKASTKAKVRTSQEQTLQDKEDAIAEREMHDMNHEYQNQMETRRQNLAKMERDAETKRSIASAADARRVVESRAAAKCGPKGKPGRNVPGISVLASVRHNGDLIENIKPEWSSLDRQSDAHRKYRIAAQQIHKQIAERERSRNEERRKLTANPLHDSYTSSVVPRAIEDASYDQGCPKSNSEQTSSKTESKIGGTEEGLISNVLPEIVTGHKSINVAVLSHAGKLTLNSVSLPTILDSHGNHYTGSVHREDSDSLFGDSHSDVEAHGEVAEHYRLPQSSEDIDIDKTALRDSQQGSRIVGQWAIVEADDSKDDTNQTSIKDSESLPMMQMLDRESKKPHTRTIFDIDPIQQYDPNKRQKLETHARGLDGSRNKTVHQDNSRLMQRPPEQKAAEPCISNKGRRTMSTIPGRQVAKRLATTRHQQNEKRDTLRQRPRRSNQSTPELMSLHAMSSGLDRPQTKSIPQARGFAALNSTPNTKSAKVTGQNVSSGAEGSRHRNLPLSRRNMHLSNDERIAAIQHQLSAFGPQEIRDVEVLKSDHADIEVLSFGQEDPPVSHVYESSSSSDEDEDEEQAKQRRLLKHSGSTATQECVRSPVAEALDSQRPTYARKGIGRKTTAPQASANDDDCEQGGPKSEPSDSTASDSDTTSEKLLWLYSVTRHTHHTADSSPDVSLSQPCGTFLTKAEANKLATAELHTLFQDAPLENAVTLRTDASGLQTCHYTTPSTDIQITVTRALARKARLPISAARLPRLVYSAYHRVIRRSRAAAVADMYSYLHLGTFSLLDMANRVAGRAWLAHELRELAAVTYAQQVRGLELTDEMRTWLDKLEAEGGYFRRGEKRVKGMGEREVEQEVDVWVDEQEVQGPRN